MRRELTTTEIEKAKLPPVGRRKELTDGKVPGLALRITSNGHKSFCVYYYFGGRHRRITLGAYGTLTLKTARGLAREALDRVARGIDPVQQKRQEAAAARAAREHTFRHVCERYIMEHAAARQRTWKETARVLRTDAVRAWAERPLSFITKRDVEKLLTAVVERGSPVAANRLLAHLRRLFNWCVVKDLLEASPAARIEPPAVEESRDRVLSLAELRLVWQGCERLGHPFGACIQLLMLTAARRDEVAHMRWTELHVEDALGVVPRERMKGKETHEVPLSPQALAILDGLPRIGANGLVFTTSGSTPISGFSAAKLRLDRIVAELAVEQGQAALSTWRLHDLRRSVSTRMADDLAVLPHVVKRILGHQGGTISGVARVYNRARYREECRAALERWAVYLGGQLEDQPGNVVPLRSGA
jgi:integrase